MVVKWVWASRKVTFPGERISSEKFKTFKEELYEYVKDHDMCKSLILPRYLKSSILKAKFVLVSISDNTLEGFATFEIHGDELHIPLICSSVKGVGTRMLDAIFEYVDSHTNIKSVTLESIPEAIGFYEKKGFDVYCPEGELCPMIYQKK